MVKINPESGFSIVQALILGGLLAWYALIETNNLKIQKEALNAAYSRDQVETVHSLVFTILENKRNCLTTIAANGIASIGPNLEFELQSIYVVGSSEPAFIVSTDTKYLKNSVGIQEIKLTTPDDLEKPSQLSIVYYRYDDKKKGLGAATFRKNIGLVFQRSDSSTPSSCMSVTTDDGENSGTADLHQEVCEDFGITYWDNNLKKCILKENTCPDNHYFTGIDEDGKKICKDFKEFLPYLIDPDTLQTCPDSYDTIRFARAENGYVVAECNQSNETCPSVYLQHWETPNNICRSFLKRGLNGEAVKIQARPPGVGEASLRCQNGVWNFEGSLECRNPCLSQTVSWSKDGKTCNGIVSNAENTEERLVSDSNLPDTGSAKFKCDYGSWIKVSGSTCI